MSCIKILILGLALLVSLNVFAIDLSETKKSFNELIDQGKPVQNYGSYQAYRLHTKAIKALHARQLNDFGPRNSEKNKRKIKDRDIESHPNIALLLSDEQELKNRKKNKLEDHEEENHEDNDDDELMESFLRLHVSEN